MSQQILEIVKLGDPVLFKKAAPVTDIAQAQDLIDNMIASLIQAKGVGLAAPQVGVSLRLYIIWPNPNSRYPNCPEEDAPIVVINPKLKTLPSKKVKDWEGCLSIPGLRGQVSRPDKVQVEFTDRYGNQQVIEAEDFPARIFQHEHDHIDGILFLDRLKSTKDLMMESEYIKLMDE